MDEFWKLILPNIPALIAVAFLYLNQRQQGRQIELNKAGIVVKSDEVEVGKDVLVLDMAREHKKLLEEFRLFQLDAASKEVAALLREREQTKDFNTQIASLQQQLKLKDEALEILRRMEPQLAPIKAGVQLANQQLTETQRKLSEASLDTQAQTDAAHTANVQKDYDSTQGRVDAVLPSSPTVAPAVPASTDNRAPLTSGDAVVLTAVPTEGTTP